LDEVARRFCEEFRNYGLKPMSVKSYAYALAGFCRFVGVRDGDELVSLGLERIEEFMTKWIRMHDGRTAERREDVLSPKYLNRVYSAVKCYCVIRGLIKSTRMFKQIRFDGTSRKIPALKEAMLTLDTLKRCFSIADLDDKIDLGFYGLMGLRPNLIPQLRVKDLHSRNYTIKDGTFKFTVKPPILIVDREYIGNKGNITFMSFIPSKLAEFIELKLNSQKPVTPEMRLSSCKNAVSLYNKIKRIFEHPTINFKGRPYLLRKYADQILERITRIYNDEDLKEFLMGHKGRISAIYQISGLTYEAENTYREIYTKACDNWINEQIFGLVSKDERYRAETLAHFAEKVGADPRDVRRTLTKYLTGQISYEAFDGKLTDLTKTAMRQQMKEEFEKLYLEMEAKYNNKKRTHSHSNGIIV